MKYLEDINTNITTDKHMLPVTTDSMELEYQKIISSLYNIIGNSVEAMDQAHSEQVEYYTMWVHQIKTPISAMQLAFQTYATTENSKLLQQELFKIEQYVELALQYTKMSNLSTDLVIREYSLEEIVNQSIKKYAQLFIFKKLSVQIEEFHEKVITDSKWLSFILEQILSNAIKYTNQGGIKISYDNHTLQIADTGMGIRKEDIERIYEKGYTGYNGRLDKKASGIGLYMTKKVADSLAIRISISSEVGQGTTVELKFPEDKTLLKREYV
jgi:signal transduction histidine kinase